MGYKYGTKVVETFKKFSREDLYCQDKSIQTDEVYKLNSFAVTDQTKADHLRTLCIYANNNGLVKLHLDDHFDIATHTGFGGLTGLTFKGEFRFPEGNIPFRIASFSGLPGGWSEVDYPPQATGGYGNIIYYKFDLFHGGGYEGLTVVFDSLTLEQFDLLEKYFKW